MCQPWCKWFRHNAWDDCGISRHVVCHVAKRHCDYCCDIAAGPGYTIPPYNSMKCALSWLALFLTGICCLTPQDLASMLMQMTDEVHPVEHDFFVWHMPFKSQK